MATDAELMECIEACRTCGIFFLTTSNFLRRIFVPEVDNPEMVLIRAELAAWNVAISENDGYPQFICTGCIHEFTKVFKFRRSCVDIQEQWRHFYNLRQENKLQIKTEKIDPAEENETEGKCDFIYVDDLSDGEYDGTPFHMANVPIKDEIIEEAAVPTDTFQNATGVVISGLENSITAQSAGQIYEESIEPEVEKQRTQCEGKQLQNNSCITSPKVERESTGDIVSEQLQCSACFHISTTPEQHRLHMQRIHDVKNLDCHICGKKFKNSTSTRLKFHLKWHKLSRHVKCAQCGFFCDSRDTLKEHTRAMHSKRECNICGKRIISKKMKAHMREHELQTDWPCSYCTSVFDSEEERESHIWQVHTNEDSISVIDGLSIATENSNNFPESNPSCADKQQLELNVIKCNAAEQSCNEQFQSLSETTQSEDASDYNSFVHRRSGEYSNSTNVHHSIPDVNDYNEGNVCNSESENNVETIQQFACAKCTQTFGTVKELCTHHKVHLKKPEMSCPICGKRFELKFSLNRHIKKHKAPF